MFAYHRQMVRVRMVLSEFISPLRSAQRHRPRGDSVSCSTEGDENEDRSERSPHQSNHSGFMDFCSPAISVHTAGKSGVGGENRDDAVAVAVDSGVASPMTVAAFHNRREPGKPPMNRSRPPQHPPMSSNSASKSLSPQPPHPQPRVASRRPGNSSTIKAG